MEMGALPNDCDTNPSDTNPSDPIDRAETHVYTLSAPAAESPGSS